MRPCPRWGGPYTVGPHTYIDTLPGSRRSRGNTSPLAVSNRRNMGAEGNRLPPHHRKGFQPAEDEVLAVLDVGGINAEAEVRVALGEAAEHDLALEPGQRGAEAVVDAVAEREVLVLDAPDVEAVRV